MYELRGGEQQGYACRCGTGYVRVGWGRAAVMGREVPCLPLKRVVQGYLAYKKPPPPRTLQ